MLLFALASPVLAKPCELDLLLLPVDPTRAERENDPILDALLTLGDKNLGGMVSKWVEHSGNVGIDVVMRVAREGDAALDAAGADADVYTLDAQHEARATGWQVFDARTGAFTAETTLPADTSTWSHFIAVRLADPVAAYRALAGRGLGLGGDARGRANVEAIRILTPLLRRNHLSALVNAGQGVKCAEVSR